MNKRTLRQQKPHYQPQSWRDDGYGVPRQIRVFAWLHRSRTSPDIEDQSAILELLGRINYRVLSGKKVYIEIGGVVYKTLFGGYWRSVFTGKEHYLLRCEQITGALWADGDAPARVVDLPVEYSTDGWTAQGHSLSFMLSRDEM